MTPRSPAGAVRGPGAVRLSPPPGSAAEAGAAMHRLITELYPTMRSITGDGLRQTLRRLGDFLPLTLHEIPSGTRVFDWTVPREWNVRDAWIADPSGKRVVDLADSSLTVVNYSVPVHQFMSLAELRPRLHTLPEDPRPHSVPDLVLQGGLGILPGGLGSAITSRGALRSLHRCDAGGRASHDRRVRPAGSELGGGRDLQSRLPPGARQRQSLGCGRQRLAGAGPGGEPRRFTYRFLFGPGTIGAITWLALNAPRLPRIRHGLVLAGVGDRGAPTWKKTRRGTAEVDRAMRHVLEQSGRPFQVMGFSLRLRRAPVQRARHRSRGGLPDAHAVGDLRRIPHLGR